MPQDDARPEPIAIVGIGCRFPGGAHTPEAYWRLLVQGRDAMVDWPRDRWDTDRFYDPDPEAPSTSHTRRGGFLTEPIDRFDPGFFGISPREADRMDPQQRLLMEVAWEAIDDAGAHAKALAGSATGVFIGGFMIDHLIQSNNLFERESADAHVATGVTHTLLSNRLSHAFDLRGPSMTIDTACSSSLVATHQACESLWRQESNLALAGGVNLMLRPETFVMMSKGRFLSTHGRCATFSAEASGYARGEGAGVVMLKRLSQAIADRDRVYAVIRATGVNQDGRTTGISLPNSGAQQDLIRSVLQRGQIAPASIQYVEAHGTGTRVGDPAELKALHAALSEQRPENNTCWVGSVKPNIGHLEAAAGIAGLIKSALVLFHQQIPPHLHSEPRNPDIPFDTLCLRIPTTAQPLPVTNEPARAAVNSFGYGGTNAHAVLEAAPQTQTSPPSIRMPAARPRILTLSARDPNALRECAGRLAFRLTRENDPAVLDDLLYTAVQRRSNHPHRLGLIVETLQTAREDLQRFAAGERGARLVLGETPPDSAGLAFICTGMGPQWWAMGRELYQQEPVCRAALEQVDQVFQTVAGWSVLQAMLADEASSRMAQTDIAQPANFALQVALAELWASWGIRPAILLGHSVGEVSAAYLAGALSLEDACRVSFHRSRLQQRCAGRGGMLAVGLEPQCAAERIAALPSICVAAINSPKGCTLAGDLSTLETLAKQLERENIFARMLRVEVPYHSPSMDDIRAELHESLAGIQPRPSSIPLVSSVTGSRLDTHGWDAAYWWRNVRDTVHFSDAIHALLSEGYRDFLEIGPHPVLGASIQETASLAHHTARTFTSLRRGEPESGTMALALAQLHTCGHSPDWGCFQGHCGQVITLPTYPWQRRRHWHESELSREDRLGLHDHPLIGRRADNPEPAWETDITESRFVRLRDHRVEDRVVFPGAGYVEAAFAVLKQITGQDRGALKDLRFERPMLMPDHGARVMRCAAIRREENWQLGIHSRSRPRDEQAWTTHVTGQLIETHDDAPTVDLDAWRTRCPQAMTSEALFDMLQRRRLHYGPMFRATQEAWCGQDAFLLRLEVPPAAGESDSAYLLHPVALDSAFQGMMTLWPQEQLLIPVRIDHLTLYRTAPPKLWCVGQATHRTSDSLTADMDLTDDQGRVIARASGVMCRVINSTTPHAIHRFLVEPRWSACPVEPLKTISNDPCLIIGDDVTGAEALVKAVQHAGLTEVFHVKAHPAAIEQATARAAQRAKQRAIRIIHLWRTGSEAHATDSLIDQAQHLFHLTLAWLKGRADLEVHHTFITRHAVHTQPDDRATCPIAALALGLGAVMGHELEQTPCGVIDLEDPLDEIRAEQLLSDVLSESTHDVRAWRAGQRLMQRVAPWSPAQEPQTVEPAHTDDALLLRSNGRGLPWVLGRTTRQVPTAHQVEIRVTAASIESCDAEKIDGRFDPTAFTHTYTEDRPGLLVTGKVTALGQAVKDFCIGDAVMGISTHPWQTWTRLESSLCTKIPDAENIQRAAALSDLVTADLALTTLPHRDTGSHVCLSGTGPLRDALETRALALNLHVDDSFGDAPLDAVIFTEGSHVDPSCWRRLHHGAAAIDLRRPARMAYAPDALQAGAWMTALNTDALARHRPERVQRAMQRVLQDLAAEQMPWPDIEVCAIDRIPQILRTPEDTRRRILDLQPRSVHAQPTIDHAERLIRSDGTYLVTGGTDGFGLEVGTWLAEQGAGRVVLVSRRGAASEAFLERVRTHPSRATLFARSLDVTHSEAMDQLLQELRSEGPPLRGVIHGAMVLQDRFLSDVTDADLQAVLGPKVLGALHLDQLTQNDPLVFFVLFSSISALIGNAGQAAYAAANAALQAIAGARRAAGKPVSVIDWGALGESGIVMRRPEIARHLEAEGIRGLSNKDAIQALEQVLSKQLFHVGAMDVDWLRWLNQHSKAAASARFDLLRDADAAMGDLPLRAELRSMGFEEAQARVLAWLADRLADITGLASDALNPTIPLHQLGVDSLMALELATHIRAAFGVELSAMELLRGPSLKALTDRIHIATQP